MQPDYAAFPCPPDAESNKAWGGMSIRTYLAAKAMQGLLSHHATVECESGNRDLEPYYSDNIYHVLASRAVNIADLLIFELNKPVEGKP